jgi:hypothetical protein
MNDMRLRDLTNFAEDSLLRGESHDQLDGERKKKTKRSTHIFLQSQYIRNIQIFYSIQHGALDTIRCDSILVALTVVVVRE